MSRWDLGGARSRGPRSPHALCCWTRLLGRPGTPFPAASLLPLGTPFPADPSWRPLPRVPPPSGPPALVTPLVLGRILHGKPSSLGTSSPQRLSHLGDPSPGGPLSARGTPGGPSSSWGPPSPWGLPAPAELSPSLGTPLLPGSLLPLETPSRGPPPGHSPPPGTLLRGPSSRGHPFRGHTHPPENPPPGDTPPLPGSPLPCPRQGRIRPPLATRPLATSPPPPLPPPALPAFPRWRPIPAAGG